MKCLMFLINLRCRLGEKEKDKIHNEVKCINTI